MSEFRNAEPAGPDVRPTPKGTPLMSDQKDLAPASYKKKRSRKKAPKASHSSLDVENQQPPGAYRATADAARRSKDRRVSRESRADSSRVDSSSSGAAATSRTRTKGDSDGRNSQRKPRQPSMDKNHKQSKTSTRTNLTSLESGKQPPSRASTMTPGPPSLDRQMYRHAEPGAQAIAGSQAHLHADDDDEESGYSFDEPSSPPTEGKRDGLTVDLTEAHMVDEVEVYQDPVYAETVDVEQQKLQERSNRRKYALWGFLAATLVAVGIALAVVFTRPGVSTSTEAPSASPTISDEFLPQFLATLSDPSDLANAASPQARAFDWIVNEDEVVRTSDEAKIQQRYAMAVLFFSTNGETAWTTNRNWLNVTLPICNWTQSGTEVCDDDSGLLREFTMDRNGMLGTIPTEIALLSQSLSVLDLTFNSLNGTLPTELGTMGLLETLHVSINDLTGTIPTELGLLTNVRQLYVDANDIMDTMPQAICDLKTTNRLEKLWADCRTNETESDVVADIQCATGCCRCCFNLECK